jgi:hypothetical protein
LLPEQRVFHNETSPYFLAHEVCLFMSLFNRQLVKDLTFKTQLTTVTYYSIKMKSEAETLRNVVETLRTQHLFNCKFYLASSLLGVFFGHRGLQTLPRWTAFCVDFSKKEFV